MKRYKAAAGAQFNDKKAQAYGEALERLETVLGRPPGSDDIWKAARDKGNPLHGAFQWNVRKAAIQYWRSQARHIASHIEIFVTIRNKQRPMRAYFSVKRHPEDPVRYVNTESISDSPYMRGQIVKQALSEAENWSLRYRHYREFRAIHASIKATKKAVVKRIGQGRLARVRNGM